MTGPFSVDDEGLLLMDRPSLPGMVELLLTFCSDHGSTKFMVKLLLVIHVQK